MRVTVQSNKVSTQTKQQGCGVDRQLTLTFQCLLTSKLADFRSLCRMGGWHMCRYSMPLAASRAMFRRFTQSNGRVVCHNTATSDHCHNTNPLCEHVGSSRQMALHHMPFRPDCVAAVRASLQRQRQQLGSMQLASVIYILVTDKGVMSAMQVRRSTQTAG